MRETSCEKNSAWMYTLSPLTTENLQATESSCITRVQTQKGSTIYLYRSGLCWTIFCQGTWDMRKTHTSVYTCAFSRAVHLGTVPDLTAEAFLRNFRRFPARHGLPREVISNDGKTFRAASKKITILFKASPELRRYLANHSVKWTFNLERTPWWRCFCFCFFEAS